jgi:glutaminyl-peptide cyclotransferase
MVLTGRLKNSVALTFSSLVYLFVVSCGNEPVQPPDQIPSEVIEVHRIPAPQFNEDSAYAFVKAQVDFGPRVPGTPAHSRCAEYLSSKLKKYGFEVTVPTGQTVKTYDGRQFALKNIIASFKPELQKRVLVCSHWDTRHITESDTKDRDKPGDGANDGASGVGVAMEIARQVSTLNPNVGVDIIYFDLEDYGGNGNNESWALGSKYWANNLHKPDYIANFGILLDMVGGPDAVFVKEGKSVRYADSVVDKVWKAANDLGYGNYFLPQTIDFVGIDDHVPVNEDAHIPCIDIIEYNQASGGFPDYHHTHKDNMDMIDKKTLKAVGQTLLEVIYNEK